MNLPTQFDEAEIQRYNAHVLSLEAVSGEILNEFRISPDEVKPKPVSARRRAWSGAPGSVQYSVKKYCDASHAKNKIHALLRYLRELEGKSVQSSENKDYWSMNDGELEGLANRYHIPPWSRTGDHLEHWFVDRTRIIDELVKRDKALNASQPTPAANVINVGQMHGSVIQQGNQEAAITNNFQMHDARLQEFLKKIDTDGKEIPLSDSARVQLGVDADTIRVQMASSHPKYPIIAESLRSIRAILEGTTGSLMASGLIAGAAKLLGQ